MKNVIQRKGVILYSILLSVFLFANSCKKALLDFSIDKSDYSAGEIINVTNRSKNFDTYTWSLNGPPGNTKFDINYSEQNSTIRINPCAGDGNYSLMLTGTTKKGGRSIATRDFLVKTIRGTIRVYNASLAITDAPIEIKADNEIVGKLYPTSELTLYIAVGTRYLTSSNGKTITLNIQEGGYYNWNLNN